MAVAITHAATLAGVSGAGSTLTFTSAAIGTASSDRIVVLLVGSDSASGALVSATIDYGTGALAMSQSTVGVQGNVNACAFYLAAPTGTTATFVVTCTANIVTANLDEAATYAVTGGTFSSSGSNNSTDMDSSTPLTTGSITIATNGGFIAIAAGATSAAKTWANATEHLDVQTGGFDFTTATRVTALSATAVTCQGTTNAEDGALAWLIFTQAVVSAESTLAGTGNFRANVLANQAVQASLPGTSSLSFNGAQVYLQTRFIVPDADSIDGTWTNETGGTVLFSSLDETDFDDADFIKSAISPVNDLCKIALSNPGIVPGQPFHVLYRYRKTSGGQVDLGVRLLQGSTEIAAWTHTNIADSFTFGAQTLTGGQFSAVSDFNNLFIEFTANAP